MSYMSDDRKREYIEAVDMAAEKGLIQVLPSIDGRGMTVVLAHVAVVAASAALTVSTNRVAMMQAGATTDEIEEMERIFWVEGLVVMAPMLEGISGGNIVIDDPIQLRNVMFGIASLVCTHLVLGLGQRSDENMLDQLGARWDEFDA